MSYEIIKQIDPIRDLVTEQTNFDACRDCCEGGILGCASCRRLINYEKRIAEVYEHLHWLKKQDPETLTKFHLRFLGKYAGEGGLK